MKHKMLAGWEWQSLGDVIATVAAGTSVNCEDRPRRPPEKGMLKLGAVSSEIFRPEKHKAAVGAEGDRLRVPVRGGSVLFVRKNTPELVGRAAYVENDCKDLFLPDLIWELRVKSGHSARWMNYWLQSGEFQALIPAMAAGSSQSMVGINRETLLESPVLVPPAGAQKLIVEILEPWDQAIGLLERLIDAKRQVRAWLRSHLLTGKGRLPGFNRPWLSEPLSTFLEERRSKKASAERVFSVSVHKGLVDQIEHLGRSFSATDTSHYNRVLPGDIIYTKSPTGDFPLGVVKQSNVAEPVIVSPLYAVYKPRSNALGTLLDTIFESPIATTNYLRPLVQKGAKNTIAITNRRFLEGLFLLPDDEQETSALAEMMESSRRELQTLTVQLDRLRAQRRGLMQALLTGEHQLLETVHEAAA